jgi:hypothetical protein
MNYLEFGKMQTMFKDKGGKIVKTKSIVEVKVDCSLVNMELMFMCDYLK